MYYLKNTLFLELTKNQRAALFSFLKSFVKKYADKTTEDILQLFIEEEEYYKEVQNPHFEWIIEEFNKEKFLKELKILINENKKQLRIKEEQKPFLEKQKELAKEFRRKTSEQKMAKQKPTKKQIYYYEKLCEKHKIKKEDIENKSRLDLKNIIGKILDEQQKPMQKGFDSDLFE